MMKKIINALRDVLGAELDTERYLVIGNAFGKKSLFLYKCNTDYPSYVIKIPDDQEGKFRCKIEYKALEILEQRNLQGILAAKPLGKMHIDGEDLYIQTAIYGKLLLTSLSTLLKIPKISLFNYAVNGLVNIYKTTRSKDSVPGRSYSTCFQHGDFWLGNIGRKGRNIILYDLEFANEVGKPLYDLLHFGLYYYRATQNIGKVGQDVVKGKYSQKKEKRVFELSISDIEHVLIRDNRFSRIMKKSILRYTGLCGIDKTDAEELVVNYVEKDREIIGLPTGWAKKVLD